MTVCKIRKAQIRSSPNLSKQWKNVTACSEYHHLLVNLGSTRNDINLDAKIVVYRILHFVSVIDTHPLVLADLTMAACCR